MDYKVFVQLMAAHLPEGLVMDNPGRGTSTILWCDRERVCYRRGGLRLYLDIKHLHEAFTKNLGKAITTSDLKNMKPSIFDSAHNGHGCHCTFFFMAMHRMGLVDEIHGTGRRGCPFQVMLPGRPARY